MIRERDVEQHLIHCVEARGGQVRKVRWIGRRAAPDRLVLLPGRHFLAELKRPKKTFTPAQQREAIRLQSAGLEVMLFNTKDAINRFFADIPLTRPIQ